jgi:pimeloyl-ACP methyl ester carboxylesterase
MPLMIAFAVSVAALAAATVSIASVDPLRFADAHLATGIRMRYAAQGDPASRSVILLHGYSDSWFSYSQVLPELARRYRVYALDLRGHGDSDRPASGYAMRDLAGDVLAFMDLQRIDRATIVGHSMGSFVAQQVVVRAPARVTGLVLIGSGSTPRSILGVSEFARAVDALPDPVPFEFARDFQVSTIHHPIADEFLDRAIAESLKLPARVWREIMAGMLATDPATALAERRVPTLILWGERDAVFARSEQDALLELVPTAAFKIYPETGHALHWERPHEFVRDLDGFIAGRKVQ